MNSLYKHRKKVKLIFNPISGSNNESPVQLMEVIKELQFYNFCPEVYLVHSGCNLQEVVEETADEGIELIIVCGGDGTISTLIRALIGTNIELGIIPTGTQNNVALSLGIPDNIKNATKIIANNKCCKIDIGVAICCDNVTPFLEICSVGLFTTLFPSGDDIQHGDISKLGDFLGTLASSPPSEIHFLMDDKMEVKKTGHVVLITNMPYIGRHYQVGCLNAYNDGLLDVLFFADVPKLDLIGYILKGGGKSALEDNRVQHFRVKSAIINAQPSMPIMADGIRLGEGLLKVEIAKQAITVRVK